MVVMLQLLTQRGPEKILKTDEKLKINGANLDHVKIGQDLILDINPLQKCRVLDVYDPDYQEDSDSDVELQPSLPGTPKPQKKRPIVVDDDDDRPLDFNQSRKKTIVVDDDDDRPFDFNQSRKRTIVVDDDDDESYDFNQSKKFREFSINNGKNSGI
uniref:Uncharacterized protein n=1 Tax=Panagrolaimus sp. JU765 TaxID=591449 RepID=A0AC34Q4G2_9BILA